MNQKVNEMLVSQQTEWELARTNYSALKHVKVKELCVEGVTYKVQFNPARIVSSAAKVDAKTLQARKCFLCPAHLPKEQTGLPFNDHYQILVNPFPIFPRHLTVPELAHVPQRIDGRLGNMLDLAQQLTDFVVFYNGPRCGASAPDHAHFQAGNKGFLPLESSWRSLIAEEVGHWGTASLYTLHDAPRATLVITSTRRDDVLQLFQHLYAQLPVADGEVEPMLNLLALYEEGQWVLFVFPRKKHRPSCYTAEGEANILLSPASVDMGGVFITPLEKDFNKITACDIAQILHEVCFSPEELKVLVNRMSASLPSNSL